MRHSKLTLNNRKRMAAVMTALTLSVSMLTPVQAAAPQVLVDETMYVNLDYYGKETQINVVKGCSTNGVTAYTDYGVYEKVVNMSDKTDPTITEGAVSWQFPAENKRFYYQCTMQEQSFALPWSFDVSYRLNGVEADAKKLAGASGLVELSIKATPEKHTKAYYRNNMMLSVVVPVDMEKAYSVEAPGAQLQTVGNSSVAIFAALPGEAGDYTVRIGTDSFESVGVIMMMAPGTMSALDHIKDLKEAKDTWREDGDAMHDGLNQLLKTAESMKDEVNGVREGIRSLEGARATVGERRKAIEGLSTQAIGDLARLAEQTMAVIPYLETAQNAISDINENVNALSFTMSDTQEELDRLYDRLGSLRNSLESTSKKIGGGISAGEQKELASDLQKKTEEIEKILAGLNPLLADGKAAGDLTQEELLQLENNLKEVSQVKLTADRGPSGQPGSGGVNNADFGAFQDEEIDKYAESTSEALESLLGTNYSSSVGDVLDELQDILGGSDELLQKAGLIIQKVNELSSSIGSTGHQTAQTISALRGVTDELINLMDDSRVLIDTVDGYVPSMLDSLGATEELLNRLAGAMGSTHAVLSLANETMIAAGDSLDAGLKESLSGLNAMLGKSLVVLDETADVRVAGEGMKNTLDEQLDKFEEENQFLNMDPEAPMISFTSPKNPSPHSLQIILRTDEISTENDADQILDAEAAAKPIELSPLARMWRVLVEIFNAVVSIFHNR